MTASIGVIVCCAWLGSIPVQPSATLFENDQVKVLRALEQPHQKGNFHEHPRNRVLIYLQPGRQAFGYPDGREPAFFNWQAGDVEWSHVIGSHAAQLQSNDPMNILEIELKTPGSNKPIVSRLDPVKIDPKHYKVEFENPQVRVLRVKIEPHGIAPMHEHSLNRVTVFLTDQDFQVTDANGKVDKVVHKAGEAFWGIPTTHQEQNMSDKPFEVIAVEIKN